MSKFLVKEDEEQRQSLNEEQYPLPSEHVPAGGGGTSQSYPRPSPRIGRDVPWYMEASSG